jgi:hypothetical protein
MIYCDLSSELLIMKLRCERWDRYARGPRGPQLARLPRRPTTDPAVSSDREAHPVALIFERPNANHRDITNTTCAILHEFGVKHFRLIRWLLIYEIHSPQPPQEVHHFNDPQNLRLKGKQGSARIFRLLRNEKENSAMRSCTGICTLTTALFYLERFTFLCQIKTELDIFIHITYLVILGCACLSSLCVARGR